MTNQEIIEEAKYLLEAEIDGIPDPTWTINMFERWLKDAQKDLLLKVKDSLCEQLYKTSTTITKALIVGNLLDSDFIRLIIVLRNNKPAFITTLKKYQLNLLYAPSIEHPICYIEGKQLFILPADDTVPVIVKYIANPPINLATESNLPILWQHLLPSYICMKALERDKQGDRVLYYKQQFDDKIALINAKG